MGVLGLLGWGEQRPCALPLVPASVIPGLRKCNPRISLCCPPSITVNPHSFLTLRGRAGAHVGHHEHPGAPRVGV